MSIKLNPLQEDALREVGNIGSGNAATALAEFIGRRINMGVPRISILAIEDIPYILGDPEAVAASVFLRVTGEAPGSIIILIEEECMNRVLDAIFSDRDLERLGHIERSALQEMGNILAGSFLNAINKMTSFNCIQSLPGFALDTAGSILNTLAAIQSEYGEDALFIESRFTDNGKDILSKFFLVPDPGSLEKILTAIGVEDDDSIVECEDGGD